MAQSVNKSNTNSNDPIVFELPGHAVDTRIKVFKTEFHVHSLILKIASPFFRAFLDSPDKTPAAPGAQFRYDYETSVDDDGLSWGLELVSKIQERGGNQPRYTRGTAYLPVAFLHILHAMYNRLHIDTFNLWKLELLIETADFYGTLPLMSVALDAAFLRSNWVQFIRADLPTNLVHAMKLRNKTLYKECMVHVVSQWKDQSPEVVEFFNEHPRVRKQAEITHAHSCAKLDIANHAISKMFGPLNDKFPAPAATEADTKAQAQRLVIADRVQHHMSIWSKGEFKTHPSYYRSLYHDPFEITEAHVPREFQSDQGPWSRLVSLGS